MKRKITSSQRDFLKGELEYLRSVNADLKTYNLEDYYEVIGRNNYAMQALLSVGAILTGIGILSLLAANWAYMHGAVKFVLIFTGVIAFYFAGWKTETAFPKTSRSFYYIGAFLFGAGIFLIGQAFHLVGVIYPAFLFWSLGILPMAYYLKDKALLSFSTLLLYAYNSEIIFEGQYPYLLFVAIPAIFAINHLVLHRSKLLFFLNFLLLIQFVHSQLWYFEANHFLIIILLFLTGIIISLKTIPGYKDISKGIGYILQGTYGMLLTFPTVWELLFSQSVSEAAAIIFAVLYGLYMIYLVKEGDLLPILILATLIFRFYVDISYDFLPRSLFFIIGGIVLITFGFWFEWRRRWEIKEDENDKV